MKQVYHNILKTILFPVVCFILLPGASAQFSTNCENSNFNEGTYKGWNGCYGQWNCGANGWKNFMCEYNSTDPPQHRIIPAPGYPDPFTGGALISVFPGEAYSARIGDSVDGGFAARLKYQITVSEDDYLFVYRYAVVLEDQGHPAEEQPGFFIAVTDEDGSIIDSVCGFYEVVAAPGMPGWNTYNMPG